MSAIYLIPPFVVSLIGAILGAVLSFVAGLNLYASTAIASYISVMLLLAAFLWFDPDPDPRTLKLFLKALLFSTALYFVVATCTWPLVVGMIWRLRSTGVL